jgi:hypothetical protein
MLVKAIISLTYLITQFVYPMQWNAPIKIYMVISKERKKERKKIMSEVLSD